MNNQKVSSLWRLANALKQIKEARNGFIDYVNSGNKEIWDSLIVPMHFDINYFLISESNEMPQEDPILEKIVAMTPKLHTLFEESLDDEQREKNLIPILEILKNIYNDTFILFKKYFNHELIKELENGDKNDMDILSFLKTNNVF